MAHTIASVKAKEKLHEKSYGDEFDISEPNVYIHKYTFKTGDILIFPKSLKGKVVTQNVFLRGEVLRKKDGTPCKESYIFIDCIRNGEHLTIMFFLDYITRCIKLVDDEGLDNGKYARCKGDVIDFFYSFDNVNDAIINIGAKGPVAVGFDKVKGLDEYNRVGTRLLAKLSFCNMNKIISLTDSISSNHICTNLKRNECIRFTCNGINYSVVSETERTVKVIPGDRKYSGVITIPEKVKFVVEFTVIGISQKAFYECSNLKGVFMPDSIRSIDDFAFCRCINLSRVRLSQKLYDVGSYVFADCKNLQSISIPESLISIGESMFSGCDNLTSVDIPSSVAIIKGDAFYRCISLEQVNLPSSILLIENGAFGLTSIKSIEIPNRIEEIAPDTFIGCEKLVSVKIPNSVSKICARAFNCCENLQSIYLPNSVKIIGDGAFSTCTKLEAIMLPSDLKIIGIHAFQYCRSLKSVIIPQSIELVSFEAFYDCTNLSWAKIPLDLSLKYHPFEKKVLLKLY